MIKRVFLICLLTFSVLNSYAQVQKDFYVNDVDNIEYVTVNFCVDNEAKINQVTILNSQTTYKNTEAINQLRQYLLSIQYYENSKLKNNCYNSTFQFINKKYKSLDEITNEKKDKCTSIKAGIFEYKSPIYSKTIITRNKINQREKNPNFSERYAVKWISECEYHLVYEKVNNNNKRQLIGESIKVKIIDVFKNGYVYKSKLLNSPESIGVIIKKN